MIYNERTSRHEQVVAAAHRMMTAARTAPKARGVDIIEIALIEGEELKVLADKMVEIGNERNRPSFIRDAGNVLQAECVVVIGTKLQSLGLNCGHCGFATCAERENHHSQLSYSPSVLGGVPEGGGGSQFSILSPKAQRPSVLNSQFQVPCSLNSIDVGIAVGSACATAADLRLDTRVMYSIGVAVEQLGWMGSTSYSPPVLGGVPERGGGSDVKLVMGIAISASSKNPFFDRPTK